MSNTPTDSVISSALALSNAERIEVLGAIHASLADPAINHGPQESHDEIASAWKDEIAKRLTSLKSGQAKTDLAERMIRGEADDQAV